jgi:hypothetical protein
MRFSYFTSRFRLRVQQDVKTLLELEELIGQRERKGGFSTFTGHRGRVRITADFFKKICRGGKKALEFLENCVCVPDDSGTYVLPFLI